MFSPLRGKFRKNYKGNYPPVFTFSRLPSGEFSLNEIGVQSPRRFNAIQHRGNDPLFFFLFNPIFLYDM
ncbi:hypothetical protein D0466_20415 [Peribacillus glennii]|uniref:Uncharacterized protein n=1 Tax=Peribacillus glennii TaxID=2303991 RepID=A0A372L7N1_9BACI|nr:hypothetical protein D0466_20415 [Peribacillus glennii]